MREVVGSIPTATTITCPSALPFCSFRGQSKEDAFDLCHSALRFSDQEIHAFGLRNEVVLLEIPNKLMARSD